MVILSAPEKTFVRAVVLVGALTGCVATLGVAVESQAPTGVIIRTFQAVGTWEAVVDGRVGAAPSVWSSDEGLHFLVAVPPDGHIVFVSPRRNKGLDLDRAKVAVHRDPKSNAIRVELPVESRDGFPLDTGPTSIAFANRGHHVELRRTPNVVGRVECRDLLERFPEMKREYESYSPDLAVMAALRGSARASRARLQVYLGTWCGHSMTEVPRLLRVADDINPRPTVECIGVGMPVASDAKARASGVTEVPVVFGSNRTAKRVRASLDERLRPEAFLQRLLVR